MSPSRPIVISASRRTDIPAFYMDGFMAAVDRGHFAVENPFNGRRSIVTADPDRVAAIVFWSKNYGPFLDGGYGEALRRKGFRLFFNFSVNGPPSRLEPNLPALSERLGQMNRLCDTFGAEAVQWRFDPICFWATAGGPPGNNLEPFPDIAAHAGGLGVPRCVTSFVDIYPKVRRRMAAAGRFELVDPPEGPKVDVLGRMASALAPWRVELALCCEKELLDRLPPGLGVVAGACVPGPWLRTRLGADAPLTRDRGQRIRAGCGCTASTDVGSYRRHPCPHRCGYCYANPGGGGPPRTLRDRRIPP